ncbi:hypothetical protein FACS1894208_11500 [Clostridia bacterium]|nr:hypothetical protein FACS1894208_11500 [Clostridia bacterium]
MSTKAELLREIDTLAPDCFGEILDFVGYVKRKRSVPEAVLMSERSLAKDWDTPEEDAAWNSL